MKQIDFFFIFALTVLAVFIWFRNTLWISAAEDTIPILISIPLFIWLTWPWEWEKETKKLPLVIPFTIFFFAGIMANLTLLLAISWICLLWSWLQSRLTKQSTEKIKPLLILPLMAFPWIALDADHIGWWFRLSSAWITAQLFAWMGQDVAQEGTSLNINGLPISVEAACAGLNTLQAMIIAGIVIAYVYLKGTFLSWIVLPQLIALAWLANTLRVIVLTMAALIIGPAFALGAFHTWGGLLVLMIMFALCIPLFALQEPKNVRIR